MLCNRAANPWVRGKDSFWLSGGSGSSEKSLFFAWRQNHSEMAVPVSRIRREGGEIADRDALRLAEPEMSDEEYQAYRAARWKSSPAAAGAVAFARCRWRSAGTGPQRCRVIMP